MRRIHLLMCALLPLWVALTACGDDSAGDCTDECVLAATQCRDTAVQTCAVGAEGCLAWQDTTDCAGIGQVCDESGPAASCVPASCPGDNDCDGVPTAEDCDDNDPDSTARVDDADCDGVLTAEDCDDASPLSTARADDADCDGVLTAEDCDDASPLSVTRAEDGDCDGVLTAEDCDDASPLSTTRAEDVDCDGILTSDDNCPHDPNPHQTDADGDLWGDECDPFADIVVFQKPDGADPALPANQDCITPAVCLTRDDIDPLYNRVSYTSYPWGGGDVEWAEGFSGQPLSYTPMDVAFAPVERGLYLPIALHLIADDLDFNVLLFQWSCCAEGGFNYARTPAVEFSKPDLADWTLPANMDCVAPGVCLTRADTQSLFNVAMETGYGTGAPAGTEWAPLPTRDATPGAYGTWAAAVGAPQSRIGQVLSLRIAGTDVYHDVVLTSWSGGGPGGGFSWVRSRALVPGCTDPAAANFDPRATVEDGYCGDWVRFGKRDYADAGLAANQDCLTANVCLTRGDTQGLYNAVTEAAYVPHTSPDDTEWAPLATANGAASDYGFWRDMTLALPTTLRRDTSVHLLTDDLYYDVVMLRWAPAGSGGGFLYVRRAAP